jgi:outer membrane murein-binding lipoprotein Lpp
MKNSSSPTGKGGTKKASSPRTHSSPTDIATSPSHDISALESLPATPPARSVSYSKRSTPTKSSRSSDIESPGLKTVGTEDTLTINHVASTSRSSHLLGMSKPVMALVGMLTLSSMGAGLWGFLTIPGLYDQIEELEVQVDRLEGEVDRLAGEVDRFAILNQDLNTSILELQSINRDLNATANRLEDSVEDLEVLNEQLEATNGALNQTASALALQVDNLQGVVEDLEFENTQLRLIRGDLEADVEELGTQVENLNATVTDLANENERLGQLSTNLETIVGFLNTTTIDLGETLDDVTTSLANAIADQREILFENTENAYTLAISNWDCAFRDTFRGDSFITDEDSVIGEADLPAVLLHVQDRILTEYCVNRTDFENYLDGEFGLLNMTTSNLYRGVAVYTGYVLNYYFPDPGLPGLTEDDWIEASYECENLPTYVYRPPAEIPI